MTSIICEKCLWGNQCSEDQGCEDFSPLNEDEILEEIHNKTEYEYEWRDNIHHWHGNDKWGDIYE